MARCTPGSRSGCPVAYALDVVGDQWTMLIVRDLLVSSRRSFRDFLEAPERMATNVLADRLARLETHGIVVSVRDPADRRRSRYYLTDQGLDLFPVLRALIDWSAAHDPNTLATPAKVRSLHDHAAAIRAAHRAEREAAFREGAIPGADRRATASRSAAGTAPRRGTSGRSGGGRGGPAPR